MMLAEIRVALFLRAVTSFFVSNEQEVAVIACEDLKVAREAHTRRNVCDTFLQITLITLTISESLVPRYKTKHVGNLSSLYNGECRWKS